MLTDVLPNYNIQIISRVCGIDPQRLRYWIRKGLLTPLEREHKRRGAPMLFSFVELSFLRCLLSPCHSDVRGKVLRGRRSTRVVGPHGNHLDVSRSRP